MFNLGVVFASLRQSHTDAKKKKQTKHLTKQKAASSTVLPEQQAITKVNLKNCAY